MKNFKRMLLCLMAMACVLTLSAQSIYDFKVKDDVGQDVSFPSLKKYDSHKISKTFPRSYKITGIFSYLRTHYDKEQYLSRLEAAL